MRKEEVAEAELKRDPLFVARVTRVDNEDGNWMKLWKENPGVFLGAWVSGVG